MVTTANTERPKMPSKGKKGVTPDRKTSKKTAKKTSGDEGAKRAGAAKKAAPVEREKKVAAGRRVRHSLGRSASRATSSVQPYSLKLNESYLHTRQSGLSVDALLTAAGLPSSFDVQDLMRRARLGVSLDAIKPLKLWISTSIISQAIAPPTTLSRWEKQGQVLTGSAADGALRLVNIIALAEKAFGDEEKARRWLAKPKQSLDPDRPGISPFEMAESEHGARLVEERLTQIAHGLFG